MHTPNPRMDTMDTHVLICPPKISPRAEARAARRLDDLAFDPEGSPITGISKHFLEDASPFLQEVLDGKGSFVEEQVA